MSGQSSVFKILVRMICIQKIRTVLKQTSVPIQRFILVILNCILLYTRVLSTFLQHLVQFPTIIPYSHLPTSTGFNFKLSYSHRPIICL